MQERYYAGLELEKDLKFCKYVDELYENHDVVIIEEPKQVLVHEMKYVNGYQREPSGRTHFGYVYHYITFLYHDMIYMVDVSPCYPFGDPDDNCVFRFVAYKRIGKAHKVQHCYPTAYSGLHSIEEWRKTSLGKKGEIIVRGAPNQLIQVGVGDFQVNVIDSVVRVHGGFRESYIWKECNPVIIKSDTWNDEHRVVNIVCDKTCDTNGRHSSFSVDLATRTICG